jgi:hypothetical protein
MSANIQKTKMIQILSLSESIHRQLQLSEHPMAAEMKKLADLVQEEITNRDRIRDLLSGVVSKI